MTAASEVLSRKWSLVIVGRLLEGGKRFSELRASIPEISPKVLSSTLKALKNHGVVERMVDDGSPVKVKYRLTEKGLDLEGIVESLEEWGEKWKNRR